MKTPPDRNTWRDLMRPALRIIDSLETNGYGTLDFRLGGGTVLMFRFEHRISKDIDLFIDDAQALSFLSPRLNDAALQEVGDYQEQANSLKLVLDAGDIDLVVSGTVIPGEPTATLDLEDRRIRLDATAEILAKKILYRAESFKARDVFDLSCALALDPDAAFKALAATRPVHAALARRLGALSKIDAKALSADLLMTETGRAYAEDMIAKVLAAMAQVGD